MKWETVYLAFWSTVLAIVLLGGIAFVLGMVYGLIKLFGFLI